MKKSATSREEQIIFYHIKRFFPDAENRAKFKGGRSSYEADIFIPSTHTVIEYDGEYWHRDRYERDIEKNEYFNSKGMYVIRIREYGLLDLPEFYGTTIIKKRHSDEDGKQLNECITSVLNLISDRILDKKLSKKLKNYELSYDEYIDFKPDALSVFYEEYQGDLEQFWEFDYYDSEKNRGLKKDNIKY